MIELNTVAVMVTIAFAALGIIWRNRSENEATKAELKADIRAIDERQRRMENDISFIRGALSVAIPGFNQGTESLSAEVPEEEQVSEAVGD